MAARVLDRQRTNMLVRRVNPRGAERAATCLFLCSVVGARAGGRQGATEPELKAAMFVPDPMFPLAEADTVIGELLPRAAVRLVSQRHPGWDPRCGAGQFLVPFPVRSSSPAPGTPRA
jgi:hypothetical protein